MNITNMDFTIPNKFIQNLSNIQPNDGLISTTAQSVIDYCKASCRATTPTLYWSILVLFSLLCMRVASVLEILNENYKWGFSIDKIKHHQQMLMIYAKTLLWVYIGIIWIPEFFF